jgi:galactose mutarotase-like enzyme
MPARHSVRRVEGHAIHSLANAKVRVSLAPEFGARVVSLRDLTSGREWFDGWAPASARRLHAPRDPADFFTGPGAGLDECLPTIVPCRVAGRDLPDHGETWTTPASVDAAAAEAGELVSAWKLRSLPLDFTRRITLSGATVRFAYTLTNRSSRPTPFLWAWHALLSLRRGDRLELPPAVRKCQTGRGSPLPWPRALPGCDLSVADLAASPRKCAKVFVGPFARGAATVHDSRGRSLSLRWPSKIMPYAGLWISRGYWNDLHHWAVEPTNARTDALSRITRDKSPLHWLSPRETREWFVTARLG